MILSLQATKSLGIRNVKWEFVHTTCMHILPLLPSNTEPGDLSCSLNTHIDLNYVPQRHQYHFYGEKALCAVFQNLVFSSSG